MAMLPAAAAPEKTSVVIDRKGPFFARPAEAGVEKIVQVNAPLMGYYHRYSIEAARRYPDKVVGVFGRFDTLAPNVAEQLKAFMAQDRMMGVRITLHQPPYVRRFREHLVDDFPAAAEAQRVPVEVFAPLETAELGKVAQHTRSCNCSRSTPWSAS